MKTKFVALLFLAGTSLFARTFVSVGIGVGGYYPPPPVYYAPPPVYYAPAPVYAAPAATVWVPGYYYPVGPRWVWRAGYWARPPYVGARWVPPRYYGGRWYRGYWRR
jgi:hypothetical protein